MPLDIYTEPSAPSTISHFYELAEQYPDIAVKVLLDLINVDCQFAEELALATGLANAVLARTNPTSSLFNPYRMDIGDAITHGMAHGVDTPTAWHPGGITFKPSEQGHAAASSRDVATSVGRNDDRPLRGRQIGPQAISGEQDSSVGRASSQSGPDLVRKDGNDAGQKPTGFRASHYLLGEEKTREAREGDNDLPSNEVISDEGSPVVQIEDLDLPIGKVAPADMTAHQRELLEWDAKFRAEEAASDSAYRPRPGLPRDGFDPDYPDITYAMLQLFHNRRTPGVKTTKSIYSLKLTYWTERDPAKINEYNGNILYINFTEPKELQTPKRGLAIDKFEGNNFYETCYEDLRKKWCLVNRKLRKRDIHPIMIGHIELPRKFNAEGKPMGRRACVEQYAILFIDNNGDPIIVIHDGFPRMDIGCRRPTVTEFTFDKAKGPRKANACTHTSYFDMIGRRAYTKRRHK